ncbi:MAG: RsmD family RNA methyltransferase [Bacteriovoracaceae bacterium]
MKNLKVYEQPSFYRFSEDSLRLAKKASEYLKSIGSMETPKVLDAFSGCGVVGLELSRELKRPLEITFLEKNLKYAPYLYKNIWGHKGLKDKKSKVLFRDFFQYQDEMKFDVIIMNPPYYPEGHFRESPNNSRNLCRTLKEWSFEDLLKKAQFLLRPKGMIFFSCKKQNLNQLSSFKLEVLEEFSDVLICVNLKEN